MIDEDVFSLYESDLRKCYASFGTDLRREMRAMVLLSALCDLRGAKVVLRDLEDINEILGGIHAHVHAEFYPRETPK